RAARRRRYGTSDRADPHRPARSRRRLGGDGDDPRGRWMSHTPPLAELRAAGAASFGGKSAALGGLIAGQNPGAPGLARSTAAYRTFVGEAGPGGLAAPAMSRADPDDVAAVGAASHAIGEAMRSAPMADALRDELATRYEELGGPPVAVRSSALGEDSREATFAGQQETYLWVRGAEGV